MIFLLIQYLILCTIIVLSGKKLTFYANNLASETNLGQAVVGLLILSIVTSIPELVSGLSALHIVNNPELMIGDIFGSNIFNLLIFFTLQLIFIKKYKPNIISSENIVSYKINILLHSSILIICLIYSGDMFSITGFFRVSSESIIMGIIIFIYIFYLLNNSVEQKKTVLNLPECNTVLWLVLYSIVLIVSAIFLTHVCDRIAKEKVIIFNHTIIFGGGFAGLLFVAISTSLPELVTSYNSIKITGKFDMLLGNILGSNLFNLSILVFGDLTVGYRLFEYMHYFTFIFLLLGILFYLFIIIINEKYTQKKYIWVNYTLILICYAIISFVFILM